MALLLSSETREGFRRTRPDVRPRPGLNVEQMLDEFNAIDASYRASRLSPRLDPATVQDLIGAEAARASLFAPAPTAGEVAARRLPGFAPTGFLQEAQAGGARPPRFGAPDAGFSPLTDIDRLRGGVFGALSGIPEAIEQQDPFALARGGIAGFQEPGRFRGIDAPVVSALPDVGVQAGPLNLTPRTVAGFALEEALDPLNLVPLPVVDEAAAAAARGARAAGRGARRADLAAGRFLDELAPVPAALREPVEEVAPGRLGVAERAEELTQRRVGGQRPFPSGGIGGGSGERLEDTLAEFRRFVDDERTLRQQRIPESEITENLSEMASRLGDTFARAVDDGASGQQIRDALNIASPRGTRRNTLSQGAEITDADFDEAVRHVAEQAASGKLDNFEALRLIGTENTRGILDRAWRADANVTPGELELLARFAGAEAEDLARIVDDLTGPAGPRGRMTPPMRGQQRFRGGAGVPGGGGPRLPAGGELPPGGRGGRMRAEVPRQSPLERMQARHAERARELKREIDAKIAEQSRRAQAGHRAAAGGRAGVALPPQPAQLPPTRTRGRVTPTARRVPRPEIPARGLARQLLELWGIPRQLITTLDTPVLRQGAVLFANHPVASARALGPMFRALANEDFARRLNFEQRNSALGREAQERGLFLASLTDEALTAEEERFFNLAERLPVIGPVVRASSRVHTTFLNQQRLNVYNQYARSFARRGAQEAEYRDMTRLLNWASGRGDLPSGLTSRDLLTAASTALFSPRFWASRIQFLLSPALMRTPQGRLLAARMLGTYAGEVALALAVGHQVGWWDAELDPRSSDFAKIKIGNTRVDPLAGFQQQVRAATQLFAADYFGEGQIAIPELPNVKTVNGTLKEATPMEIIANLVRGRLNPATAVFVDGLTGETYVGEDVTLKEEVENRLIPLPIQDIMDAYDDDGVLGSAGVAVAAFSGLSTTSFESLRDARDAEARLRGFDSYEAASAVEQGAIDRSTRISAMLSEFDSPYNDLIRSNYEEQGRDDARVQPNYVPGDDGLAPLTPEEWRRRRSERDAAERAARGIVFPNTGGPPFPSPSDQYERYINFISANTLPDGEVDWDIVSLWRSGLSEEQNAEIDRRLGKNDTPFEQFRREVASYLDDAGFFAIRDETWESVQRVFPEAQQYRDYNEFLASKRIEHAGTFADSPDQRQVTTNAVNRLPIARAYSDLLQQKNLGWVKSADPVLVRAAVTALYTTLNADEREALQAVEAAVRAGTITRESAIRGE